MPHENTGFEGVPGDAIDQQPPGMIERLLESEKRYRRLFETAKDGILILEIASGKITDANPFIENLLGYAAGELKGKELWEIGFFRDIDANRKAFQILLEIGYIRYEHLPLQTKDGSDVDVEFVSNVYHVDRQAVIQCNVRDITERRRLERKTVEQTDLLVDLNYRKDELLAMLSHELRNPLAAISTAARLLRVSDGETSLQKRARKVIERQVLQLSRLIGDLMGISRLSSDRIQVLPERIDLNEVIRQSIETAQRFIDERRHTLSAKLAQAPVWVHVDAGRMEQVFVNLLENACKYTNNGGRIELTLDRQGADAVITVRDKGIGMPPDLVPHVFDLFAQGHRDLGRQEAGLGIGLTLVKRIVELHHGTVEAASLGVGCGSEFMVRLPAVFEDGPQALMSPEIKHSSGRLRILVVDDNADAADTLAMLLDSESYVTKTVYLGELVLGTALNFRPDIILLDIGMPDMDGYEVAVELHAHPQLQKVRIIAVTGYGQDSDRDRSKKAGFDDHLIKPIDFDALTERLHDLEGKHPAWA